MLFNKKKKKESGKQLSKILFKNNVMCRRWNNQHSAKKHFNFLKQFMPQDKAQEFKKEWSHYKNGELSHSDFGEIVNDLVSCIA